jgi:flagellar biosynthesis/type III secretory pathway chaperone
MTPALIDAVGRLADTIARENAALDALDLTAAAGMLAEKNAAIAAFTAADDLAQRTGPYMLAGRQREETLKQAERLRTVTAENKRLLERAIAVQGRVIGTVVAAAKPAAQRYGAQGSLHRGTPAAMALSSRA